MKTRFLLSTFSFLLAVASATTLRAQDSGSGSAIDAAGGIKGKPSPTPTPAPTPFVDDVLQWNPSGSSAAFSSAGNANWYDVTTSTGGAGPGGATTFNTLKFVGAGTNSKDAPTAMSVGATTSFSSLIFQNNFNSTNTTTISNGTASNFIFHILSSGDITDNASSGTVTFSKTNTGTFKFDLHGPATFSVASGASMVFDSTVVIEDASASTGSITKTGLGTVTLAGTNTYTGTTSVSAGILNIQNASALGTSAAGTSVSNNATLQIQGGIIVSNEVLTLNGTGASGQTGALVNVSGSNTWGNGLVGQGTITLAASSTISALPSSTLTLRGGVSKDGVTLTLSGGGTININNNGITGASANSDVIIDGVTVNYNVANTYNGTTYIRDAGILNTIGSPTAGRQPLIMDDAGTGSSQWLLNGSSAVGSLTGAAGSIVNINGAANALTIGSSSGTTTFAGTITGTGSIIKDMASTQILSGSNSYSGGTNLNNGKLFVNNTTGSGTGSGAVSVTGSGTVLGGSGTISGSVSLTNGSGTATLAPGANGDGSTAKLKVGALTLNSNSVFSLDLNGNVAGTSYDQLVSLGNVTLGSAALNLNSISSLSVGNVLTIVDNQSSQLFGSMGTLKYNSVTLNNGDTFTSGIYAFRIFYNGGDGNNVVLDVTAIPEPSTWVAAALAAAVIGYWSSANRRRIRSVVR